MRWIPSIFSSAKCIKLRAVFNINEFPFLLTLLEHVSTNWVYHQQLMPQPIINHPLFFSSPSYLDCYQPNKKWEIILIALFYQFNCDKHLWILMMFHFVPSLFILILFKQSDYSEEFYVDVFFELIKLKRFLVKINEHQSLIFRRKG